MVKIDRNRKSPGDFSRIGRRDVNEVVPGQRSTFAGDLLEKEDQICQMRMKEILAEIDKLGAKLSSSLNVDDLMKYKKLVQNFLKEATSRAYAVNRESSFTRRGARSVLVSIKKINQEVEDLLAEFIRGKKESFEVLETIDKIRGMLVDMLA